VSNQADEVPTDLIETPQDAVMAACRLQAEVSEAMRFQHAADCFCGERREWVARGLWRNEGRALQFIIDATREKLAAIRE